MKKVIRASYRGALKDVMTEEEVQHFSLVCGNILQEKIHSGELMTGGVFYFQKLMFLYVEYLTDEEVPVLRGLPEGWFVELEDVLELWPEDEGKVHWVYMLPTFYTDVPQDADSWKRTLPPDARCGRIAKLYDAKVYSYLSHHNALVQEGLLRGDRYQFISYHENFLFSYFETPRDREVVNIRRSEEKSQVIEQWLQVAPDSHFYHYPEAGGENFMIIETLCAR